MQNKGYLGIAKETVFGTEVAAAAYLPVKEIEAVQDPQNYYPKYVQGTRSAKRVVPGGRKNELTITADAEPDSLGWYLLLAVGAPTTTTPSAGVYQHVFKPKDTLPSASTYSYDGETQVIKQAGVKADEFTISAEAGGESVEVELSCLSKTFADGGAAGTPAYTDKAPFPVTGITVKKDGAAYDKVQKFELTYTNNLKDDDYRLNGSRDVAELAEGEVEVTGSITIRFSTKADKDDFMNGATDAWEILLTGELISGANYNTLKIELPTVSYDAAETPISAGEQETVCTFEFTALYNATLLAEVAFTLINAKASY